MSIAARTVAHDRRTKFDWHSFNAMPNSASSAYDSASPSDTDSILHLGAGVILHWDHREIMRRAGLRQVFPFSFLKDPMQVIMHSNRDLCFKPVGQLSRIIQAAGDALREQAMGRVKHDRPTLIHASYDRVPFTVLDCSRLFRDAIALSDALLH